jgi:alpha-tubulin suppressor-like RCC1 family protein
MVGDINDWDKINGGSNHTVAIKKDGTLWTCGLNEYGQLGLGDVNDRSFPTQVGTMNDWIKIICGYFHTIAIKKDGTLWVWGFNYLYQLGLGDVNDRSFPTQVGTMNDYIEIANSNNTPDVEKNNTSQIWVCDDELGVDDDDFDRYFPRSNRLI